MALQLLDSLASDWNPKQYKDTYVEELRDRIEAKEAGEEIVADETEERQADVIDLSEALQRSLDEARGSEAPQDDPPQDPQVRLTAPDAASAEPWRRTSVLALSVASVPTERRVTQCAVPSRSCRRRSACAGSPSSSAGSKRCG